MIQFDIKADVTEARRFYRNVKQRAISRAASRAINDSLVTMRAEGSRQIKQEHPALRIGDIKNNITTTKATPDRLTGSVETKGRPLSALLYGAHATKRLGVTARFGKGPRRPVQYHGRRGFIVDKLGREVFVRAEGNGRRIKRFRGPSLPGMFRAQTQFFLALAKRRFAIRFEHQMQYEIELAKR